MILADFAELLITILTDIIKAMPIILGVIIIILIGYAVASLAGKAANKVIEKIGIERSFERTITGKTFRSAGLDLSSFIGTIIKAFIIILSVSLAVEISNISGTIGDYLSIMANYLPRLPGGIIVIVFGIMLADFLSTSAGRILRVLFSEAKHEIDNMLENLLLIGLIAFVILLGLDTMLLPGNIIYPLILGFVIIGAGVVLTDAVIKTITDDHSEFKIIAGYTKFVFYSILLIIGTGAIFATFTGVTEIISNISWAFTLMFVIILIPVGYALLRNRKKNNLSSLKAS